MDPSANKEQIDKFIRLINEIIKSCGIEDDKSNIVMTLTKIESSLNYFCEARNILVAKDQAGTITHNDTKIRSIRDYEMDVDSKRRERKFEETKEENRIKEAELKER